MKDYVELELIVIPLKMQDIITASSDFVSNDVEFDVTDWLGGFKA